VKKLLLAAGIFLSTSAASNTIPGYDYPVLVCNGCSLEEIEQKALNEAKVDELLTIAVIDLFSGKALTYQVEKYINEESDGVRFINMITPIENEEKLNKDVKEVYEHNVKLWNLNSEAMKALKKERAKLDKNIFILGQ
jgi:hypothetical protein